jgi:large subunit ribosomal protein L16
MALMPKRVKYRKTQRGKLKGNALRGNQVAYGEYGLQSLEHGYIEGKVIEAARVAANRYISGQGRLWIRIFPHKSFTSTPAETRLGTGKGEPNFYAAAVKPGTILYEVGGIPEEAAKTALVRSARKLPVKCRFVARRTKI